MLATMEYLTLDDMSEQFSVTLADKDKRLVANFLNATAKHNGLPTQQVRKRTKTASGNNQSYWVTAYPEKLAEDFENLCMMLGAFTDA